MNTKHLNLSIVALLAGVMLVSCGPGGGFKSKSISPLARLCASCSDSGSPDNPEDPWSKIDLEGTVAAGPLGTHQVVDLDKVNNLLILRIPLPNNPFGGMISIPVPQYPDIRISLEQDPSSGAYYLVAEVPLRYVVRGVEFTDENSLPNGRPLPGIPGGELPRLGLKIFNSKYEGFLYLGKGAVGLFVPTPKLDPYLVMDLTFPIKNKSQRKVIGYVSMVSKSTNYSGGFFTSVVLPPDIQRAIDDLL